MFEKIKPRAAPYWKGTDIVTFWISALFICRCRNIYQVTSRAQRRLCTESHSGRTSPWLLRCTTRAAGWLIFDISPAVLILSSKVVEKPQSTHLNVRGLNLSHLTRRNPGDDFAREYWDVDAHTVCLIGVIIKYSIILWDKKIVPSLMNLS